MMKTIIMDFNDTIDNTAASELRALKKLIKAFKLKTIASELLINLNSMYLNSSLSYDKCVKKTLLKAGIKKELLSKAMKIFKAEADEIKIKAGFKEVLKNFNVIIFTSASKEPIIKLLKKNDIKTNKFIFYDNIVKPSLKELKRALEENGLDARKTYYVGDDIIRDMLPAKELGMKTIIISDYVDYNINKLSELIIFK